MREFLEDNLSPDELPDLLLTGENGDETLDPFYDIVESNFAGSVSVARFKHFCGEYCTASSFACWLSIQILETGIIPTLLIKKEGSTKPIGRILIYNNFRGAQHSFMMISKSKK
jgi:hypothetical protein